MRDRESTEHVCVTTKISTKCSPLQILGLPVADVVILGNNGLRTGSSMLTGEEKSEQPRPSELMGIDPSLPVPSLSERENRLLTDIQQ